MKALASLLLAAAVMPAAAQPKAKAPSEPAAAELAAQLVKAAEKWVADPADSSEAAPELKAKYRVLHRVAADGSKIYAVVAPSSVAPARLLQYGDAQPAGGQKLVLQRAWLRGHFLVLQFDAQKQYRDLRRADSSGGLELAGYVAEDGSARGFKKAEAFEHALKTFVKAPVPPGLAATAAKLAGGKPYTLEAVKAPDRVVIAVVLPDGSAYEVKPRARAAGKPR